MDRVYWLAIRPENPPKGYWDHGLIQHILDKFKYEHSETNSLPVGEGGGIVVIPARNQASDIEAINAELAKLTWCVVILTGDEESVFPFEQLSHPNMRIWVMSPQQGRHDSVSFKIGSGFRYEQPEIMREIGLCDRELDWFFSGQITHPIREQMAVQLRGMSGGVLFEQQGFGQGLTHREYLEYMARAKFVPCPSGPVSPDNFRLYEALEAGCIPIADGGDYWPYLFGEPVPFPIVSSWDVLPELLETLKANYQETASKVFAWWQRYKRRMTNELYDDIIEVSGVFPPYTYQDVITVLMPTSAIPSHPNTEMIEKTIASVRDRLPTSEIIVMFDGLDPSQAEHKPAYDSYITRLLWKMNYEYKNMMPIVMPSFSHQTGMTIEALTYVETPAILFVEHDTPLIHDTPFDDLLEVVLRNMAYTVRLNHEDRILDEHKYLQIDDRPRDMHGVPMIRSKQWSQRPHLSLTQYYRDISAKYWKPQMFIEHCMYGVIVHGDIDEHRLYIYAPEGNMLRSTNLNGRAYQVDA